MTYYLKLALFLTAFCLINSFIQASDETFILSRESYEKIHSDEFVNVKKNFAESPSYFQVSSDFNIPKAIAFEDEKIRLTPGDVIKLSEDLTFSDWGGSSSLNEVAEEDFTLPNDKVKKTEEAGQPKTKNIKFSRSPS